MINQAWIEQRELRKATFKASAPETVRALVMARAWELFRKNKTVLTGWKTYGVKFSECLRSAWKQIKKEVFEAASKDWDYFKRRKLLNNTPMFFRYDVRGDK